MKILSFLTLFILIISVAHARRTTDCVNCSGKKEASAAAAKLNQQNEIIFHSIQGTTKKSGPIVSASDDNLKFFEIREDDKVRCVHKIVKDQNGKKVSSSYECRQK